MGAEGRRESACVREERASASPAGGARAGGGAGAAVGASLRRGGGEEMEAAVRGLLAPAALRERGCLRLPIGFWLKNLIDGQGRRRKR